MTGKPEYELQEHNGVVFTSTGQQLSPEEVVRHLNRGSAAITLLTEMSNGIHGVLDDYQTNLSRLT